MLRLMKKIEKNTNKIRIPKKTVEKFGSYYYMEIHEDKIVLIPTKKGD